MTSWAHKHRPWRKALRSIRHAAEGLAQALLMGLFWLLPVDWASDLGGWLARQIGTRLPVNGRVRKHLRIAFPDITEAESRRIIAGMWDNLGRMVAEYPHLGTIADPKSGRIEVHGEERLAALRQAGRPFLLVSAHMANFELMPISSAMHGHRLTVVARRVNNPLINGMVLFFRQRATGDWGNIPKGVDGARKAVKLLKQGLNVGILVDQRSSQGVALPLFGRPARTTLGAAKLAIDCDVEIMPAQLERLGGARFRLSVEEPLQRPATDDRQAAAVSIMSQMNRVIERWVRQRPQDWLWLHRRWDRP